MGWGGGAFFSSLLFFGGKIFLFSSNLLLLQGTYFFVHPLDGFHFGTHGFRGEKKKLKLIFKKNLRLSMACFSTHSTQFFFYGQETEGNKSGLILVGVDVRRHEKSLFISHGSKHLLSPFDACVELEELKNENQVCRKIFLNRNGATRYLMSTCKI